MILKRIYDEQLAAASYLVGCSATGEALVIDPTRDATRYLDAAKAEGVRVTHVTETHIHADFVSGSRELAARAGARLLLSDEGGADWRYGYAEEDDATLLHDGDVFQVGNVRLEVLHTPGHTPEHLCFLLTDTAASDLPMGIFSGDTLFVGSVGRPDLLEKAAGVAGSMEQASRDLFRSLQRLSALPDYLQVWPGHGAGSACGKGLGAIPQSTVGYERWTNWALAHTDTGEFVAEVLEGQPEPPTYFARMKRINRDGPTVRASRPRPPLLTAPELAARTAQGGTVVDLRPAGEYARASVPGSLSIPLNRSFTTWAGWLIPADRDVYLVVGEERVEDAVRYLDAVGIERVAGFAVPAVVTELEEEGHPLHALPEVTPEEAAERISAGAAAVLDVRSDAEWLEGHIPGVANIALGLLDVRLAEVLRDRPLIVHCKSGARSAIAASLLRARGFTDVSNLAGGFDAWAAAGHVVERATREHAGA